MIIFDTETTGLNRKECSIASIGAIDTITFKTFYEEPRIFEGARIEQKALEITGFTESQLRDKNKKSFREVFYSFKDFMNNSPDKTIGGANPGYDRDMMDLEIERYNLINPKSNRLEHFGGGVSLDLLSCLLAHYIMEGIVPPMKDGRVSINADTVFQYVGLGEYPRKTHNALMDAKMEAEGFSRLLQGRKLLDDFKDYPILYRVIKEYDKNSPYPNH